MIKDSYKKSMSWNGSIVENWILGTDRLKWLGNQLV